MTTPTRASSSATAQQNLILYRRAIHPDHVEMRGRRSLAHGAYEAEVWVLPRGHMARFRHNGFCACELVADLELLPEEGQVALFPCIGERDYQHRFDGTGVAYALSFQTENLSGTLFDSTYEELKAFGEESGALVHEWGANGRSALSSHATSRGMSIVDVQRYAREVHVQGYHLLSDGGLVLRTQALFEHR